MLRGISAGTRFEHRRPDHRHVTIQTPLEKSGASV